MSNNRTATPLLNTLLAQQNSSTGQKLQDLDLDLENYSLNELYNLFNISRSDLLNEDVLRKSKQIVLKMHPDKSKLDAKYFLFFSKAYKRLYSIYEFTNRSTAKSKSLEEYEHSDNNRILHKLFTDNTNLQSTSDFNTWFNDKFEKHRIDNPLEDGHGDWLKSNDGYQDIDNIVTKENMNAVFEQQKKAIQSLSVYKGVSDSTASILGGSLLDGSSSGGYTDLKQAYSETLIPVSQEDYDKILKYKNVSEYKQHRDKVDITPMSTTEAINKLERNRKNLDEQSMAQAFKYAKESEKVAQEQMQFWGDIKRITS